MFRTVYRIGYGTDCRTGCGIGCRIVYGTGYRMIFRKNILFLVIFCRLRSLKYVGRDYVCKGSGDVILDYTVVMGKLIEWNWKL